MGDVLPPEILTEKKTSLETGNLLEHAYQEGISSLQ